MTRRQDTPSPGDKSAAGSALRDSLGGMAAKGLAAVTTSTESFVEMAAMSDMYEIEAAALALRRTKRADVRAFAEQMIRDHRRTSEDLKSMAGSMNQPMTLPTKLNAVFQTLVDDLNGVPDEDFDRRYLAQQEDAHGVAITLLKTYRDRGDNTALRELCRLAIPTLEHHLAMVNDLRARPGEASAGDPLRAH